MTTNELKPAYANIDMQRTGRRRKHMIKAASYAESIYSILQRIISVSGIVGFGLTVQ